MGTTLLIVTVSKIVNSVDGPYRTIISILDDQEDELFHDLNGTNCNDYITVHNNKLAIIIHIEIPVDNSCDSDDGEGEEPLIQEPDLESLVSRVSPELLEHTLEHHLTPSASASSTEPDIAPPDSAPPAEPDTTLHTVIS